MNINELTLYKWYVYKKLNKVIYMGSSGQRHSFMSDAFHEYILSDTELTDITEYISMPVKDEVLDITPTPWHWEERDNAFYIHSLIKDGEETRAVEICKLYGDENIDFADTKAICTAVNNTYGKGYNPAAMEELMNTLEQVENYFDKQHNPGKWAKRLNGLIKTVLQNAKL